MLGAAFTPIIFLVQFTTKFFSINLLLLLANMTFILVYLTVTFLMLASQVFCQKISSGLFKAAWLDPENWEDPKIIWPNTGSLTWRYTKIDHCGSYLVHLYDLLQCKILLNSLLNAEGRLHSLQSGQCWRGEMGVSNEKHARVHKQVG